MNETDQRDIAAVAVELQEALLGADQIEAFLLDLARRAASSVPNARSCGVTVRSRPGRPPIGATTDGFAERMDSVQYAVDDGPCLHCLRTGQPVFVEDIPADPRWPAFADRGAKEGAGASFSVPLVVMDQPVGALNLYSTTVGSLTAVDRARAGRFADVAAGAVGLALRLAESATRERNLEIALRSRTVVDQAIGVLMGQGRIPAAAAFDVLRLRSQHTNVKLRDVAAAVVVEAARSR